MKAFIVVAFLAVSVAAQSMDLMDLVNKQRDTTMLKFRPLSTIEDLLLKGKLGRRNVMNYNTNTMDSIFDVEDMSSSVYGDRRGVLTITDLMSTTLFRQYLELPLFVKLMTQHPIVFQRYVESPLFQMFWTEENFQMYFRNPVLFYKYIVPQVKLIAQTVVPSTEGIFDFDTTTTTSRFNPYSTYEPRYNKEFMSVPRTMNMNTMMGEGIYGNYPTTTPTTHYKYLLEKMMNHLNMNTNMQDVSEMLTDIQMLPTGQIKEQTKIVDPITRQEKITIGDIKLVDEKIMPVQSMDFPTTTFGIEGMMNKYPMNKIFGKPSIKDILLKNIILSKMFGDKKVITPEVYEILFGGEHKQVVPEMYDMIFKNKNVMTPEMLESVFGLPNKHIITPEVFDTLFNTKKTFTPEIYDNFDTLFGVENKKVLTPELYEILFNGNKHVMTPQVLETLFGSKVYTPEVYGRLFGDNKMFNTEDVYNKYNVNYEPFTTYNKMNKYNTMNPFITRMLKNTETKYPKMKTLEKIQTEKMIEEIQKENIMKEIIKNKIDTEIPTTMTGRFHIPLTYGKPIVGSGIQEFGTENKEIKF